MREASRKATWVSIPLFLVDETHPPEPGRKGDRPPNISTLLTSQVTAFRSGGRPSHSCTLRHQGGLGVGWTSQRC